MFLKRVSGVSRFPFVANLFDVSLDERVDLLNVDFTGFIVANLIERNRIGLRAYHHGNRRLSYLRNRLSENLLVLLFCYVLLVVMRFQDELHLFRYALDSQRFLEELQTRVKPISMLASFRRLSFSYPILVN